MKKSFKSILALIIGAVMILSMMPSASAAVKADLAPTITLFGTDAANTAALNDSYFFTTYEAYNLTDKTLASNLGKVVKFDETNSGIQFELGEEKTVKRIDLWILSVGGIENYRVLASSDGADWTDATVVMNDALPVYDGTVAASEDAPVASYYPIIFDKAVTASHLRFVIDSFADDSNTAYIAEAKVYDTNEINLGEHRLLYDENAFPYKNASPYLADYNSSTTYAWKKEVTTGDGIMMWPYYNSGTGNHQMIRPDFTSADGEGTSQIYDNDWDSNGVRDFWYSTDFGRSKVKVNRIGITIDSKADDTVCITEFEVYAFSECGTATPTTGYKQAQMPTTLAANAGKYTKIATIKCNLTKETDSVLFDISNAVEANGYMINITGHTGFTSKPSKNFYNGIESVKMYAVSDSEFTPSLTDAKVTGAAIAAGEKLTFSAFSVNNEVPNAKVFFALYADKELEQVTVADCPLSGIGVHTAEYTVPSGIEGELTVTAFLWDGVTLRPILKDPVTTLTVPASAE